MGDSSDTLGLNKVNTGQAAFLGDMQQEQLVTLIKGNKSILQYRAESSFNKLDVDNSGSLDLQEIKSFLQKSMGDD
eukprot:CAMPEP_0116909250 /NCGR_PEP_ID=MMETSP0467-20121206/14170_1 /TAXON_ID=283647 /ORGANISM="Mesodinium pulex, Strain SPMC105" /LENGTH=75 /DNA_ID=CAMNT_0004584585 /DNA_START=600 /DNA_END=827 /DNA_ORIENTATION=+